MQGKKVLAILMATVTVLGAPLSAFAEEIDASGGVGSGSADTNFSVDAETLGGGLMVLIPDEIVLEYNEGEKVFEKTTQITAKGFVAVDKHLEVSVPTDIEYALENFASVTAAGTVTFGTTVDANQVENWTQEELKTKDDGNTVVGVAKDITVEVPESNVLDIGTYKAVISFSIDLLGEQVDDATLAANFDWVNNWTVAGFADGVSLAEVVIPATNNRAEVGTIQDDAFANKTEITSVKLPDTFSYIGSKAFENCSNLASVTFKGVTYTDISDLTDAITGAGGRVGADAFTGTAMSE